MQSKRLWAIVSQVYDHVNMALWACALALVIFFAVFVAPRLPQAQADAESRRILHDVAENRTLCEHWGLKPDTRMYERCILDLQKFRTEIRRQAEEDSELLF